MAIGSLKVSLVVDSELGEQLVPKEPYLVITINGFSPVVYGQRAVAQGKLSKARLDRLISTLVLYRQKMDDESAAAPKSWAKD